MQRERINNAYLLVYERIEKFDLLKEEEEEAEREKEAPALVKNDPSHLIERVLQGFFCFIFIESTLL